MDAAMRVSSSLSLGSAGVARVSESFSSLILRRDIVRQLQRIEARGLLGQLDGGVDGALIGLGGEGLGIVGDVGGFDPVGAAGRPPTSASSRASASSMNFCASRTVGGPAAAPGTSPAVATAAAASKIKLRLICRAPL